MRLFLYVLSYAFVAVLLYQILWPSALFSDVADRSFLLASLLLLSVIPVYVSPTILRVLMDFTPFFSMKKGQGRWDQLEAYFLDINRAEQVAVFCRHFMRFSLRNRLALAGVVYLQKLPGEFEQLHTDLPDAYPLSSPSLRLAPETESRLIEEDRLLFSRDVGLQNQFPSSVACPFVSGGKLRGLVVIRGWKGMQWVLRRGLLEAYQFASLGLKNRGHYMQLDDHVHSLETINSLFMNLASTLNVHQVVSHIGRSLESLYDFELILMFSPDEASVVEDFPSFTKSSAHFTNLSFPLRAYLKEMYPKGGAHRPTFLDQSAGSDVREYCQFLTRYFQVERALFIPFIVDDHFIGGALTLFKSEAEAADVDLDLLAIFAQQSGTALRNAYNYERILMAREYNQEILDHLLVGVAVTDEQGMLTEFNGAMQRYIQVKARHVKDMPLSSIESRHLVFASMLATQQSGKPQRIEFSRGHPGKESHFSVSTLSFKRDSGHSVIAICTDVTQTKAMEKQVEKARQLTSLGTMAAGIAHEIKNPLVAIKSFTQMMPSKWDDEEFRDKYSSLVGRQVTRIDDLCQLLLRLGQPHLSPVSKVNLSKLFDEIRMLISVGDDGNVSYSIECEPDIVLECDQDQLTQVLINLGANAKAAIPEGRGAITFRAFEKDLNRIVIEVQDNGEGMNKKVQDRIFDPFFSGRSGGTGLGMSIVHRIILDHQGRISVVSRPNFGTTFRIELPRLVNKEHLGNVS